MKKQSQVALVSIVAVLVVLSYCHFREATPEMTPIEPEDSSVTAPSPVAPKAKAVVPPPTDHGTEGNFLPTKMEDPARFEVLQKSLQEMGTCLHIGMTALDPQAEFSYETLMGLIAQDMGDVVMKNDEWFSTDIRTPQGEVRRLYLEVGSNVDNEGQRTLKYFSMSKDGGQKEIPLSTDQATNPSETLLASLESDGTVIGQSKSQRTFFENGDNLLTVEKNGKIYSFQLPHDGKVFMCSGVDSAATLRCSCR